MNFIKKAALLIVLGSVTSIFFSCEEVHPPIVIQEINQSDTSFVASETEPKQDKILLIEEFTGVRCSNCPDGSDFLKQLADQNADQTEIVVIHTGAFAVDIGDEPTLIISEGGLIETLLGNAPANPGVSINRQLFSGQDRIIQINQNDWASSITNALTQESKVNINLDKKFDVADNTNRITVNMHFTENVEGIVKFTVLLIENEIFQSQYNSNVDDGIQEDYKHEHILRALITSADGNFLEEDIEEAKTFIRVFEFNDLDPLWVTDHMKIIAFVHLSGAQQDVLQLAAIDFN